MPCGNVGTLGTRNFPQKQRRRGVEGAAMRQCVTHDLGRRFKSFNGVAGSMFFRCKDWVFANVEDQIDGELVVVLIDGNQGGRLVCI